MSFGAQQLGEQVISLTVKGYQQTQQQLNHIFATMQKINRQAQNQGQGLGGGFGTPFGRMARGFGTGSGFGLGGMGLGVAGGGALAAGFAVGHGVKQAANFEQEMANVRKTTGYTADEMERVGRGVRDMAVELRGISREDISKIAEVTGQIGVYTPEQNLRFTKSTAMISATSDMSAEEAGLSGAQILNVYQQRIEMADNLYSMLTKLSAETAATEGQLADMMLRVGGSGEMLGFSMQQAAALSATLRDLGVHVERGGTALSQIFTMMATSLEDVASVAKISEHELKAMVSANPWEALKMVLRELAKLDKFERANAIKTLGLDGEHAFTSMAKLAANLDTVERNLVTANAAFAEGTAHIKEFEAGTNTLWGEMERLRNAIENLEITKFGSLRDIMHELANESIYFLKNVERLGVLTAMFDGGAIDADKRTRQEKEMIDRAEQARLNRVAADDALWNKEGMANYEAGQRATNKFDARNPPKKHLQGLLDNYIESIGTSGQRSAYGKLTAGRMMANADLGEAIVKTLFTSVKSSLTSTSKKLTAPAELAGMFGQKLFGNLVDNNGSVLDMAQRLRNAKKQDEEEFEPTVFDGPQELDMAIQKALLSPNKVKTDEEYLKEIAETAPKAEDVKAIMDFIKSGQLKIQANGTLLRIE